MTATSMRRPAYAATWAKAIKQGAVPTAGVFGALVLLDHWDITPNWPALVVPEDTDPAELDFGVVRGRDVTLAYFSTRTPSSRLIDAINAILRGGAVIVASLDRSQHDTGIVAREAVICQ